MWTLKQLQDSNVPMAYINNKWIPARPLNTKKEYLSVWKRIKRAWAVFTGRADAFTWPEGQ